MSQPVVLHLVDFHSSNLLMDELKEKMRKRPMKEFSERFDHLGYLRYVVQDGVRHNFTALNCVTISQNCHCVCIGDGSKIFFFDLITRNFITMLPLYATPRFMLVEENFDKEGNDALFVSYSTVIEKYDLKRVLHNEERSLLWKVGNHPNLRRSLFGVYPPGSGSAVFDVFGLAILYEKKGNLLLTCGQVMKVMSTVDGSVMDGYEFKENEPSQPIFAEFFQNQLIVLQQVEYHRYQFKVFNRVSEHVWKFEKILFGNHVFRDVTGFTIDQIREKCILTNQSSISIIPMKGEDPPISTFLNGGQLDGVRGLCMDSRRGHLHVADSGHNAVQSFK